MKIVDLLIKERCRNMPIYDKRARKTDTLSFYHKIIKHYLYYIRIRKNVGHDLQNFNLKFCINNKIKDLKEAL